MLLVSRAESWMERVVRPMLFDMSTDNACKTEMRFDRAVGLSRHFIIKPSFLKSAPR